MAHADVRSAARTALPVLGYGLMLGFVVVAYFLIRSVGAGLAAPAPAGQSFLSRGPRTADLNDLLHVLLALAVVIATARGLGTLFRMIHQPPVVGEIIAGFLLGPSLLGRMAPSVSAYLLPQSVGPFLGMIAQMGIILYMFLVGIELDPALLRQRGHSTVAVSHASIIAPFLLGSLLALLLYPRFSSSDVPFTNFSLFLGVSMSVTAFPVLARILTDRGIHKTRMGAIAITCAAVNDVTAWCLLALVVSVARAEAIGALNTAAMALGFIVAMFLVVRPAMYRLSLLYGNRGRLTQGVTALIFVALLLSASATELIGIHALFGAFALGAVIPHDSGMARDLTDRLEDLVVVLLLPAFFAFTGLRTQIGLVSGTEQWAICGLIIAVASLGKFGGSAIAARLTGLNWRDASALGVLMNTRGLMELIVLNIGLEMGVISPRLFAMLVIMALVTTFMTTPILHLITRREEAAQPQPAAEVPVSSLAYAAVKRDTVLVPVSDPGGVQSLVELALAASSPGAPPPQVLALVRRPVGGVRSGLREVEERVPPRSQALSVALELARSRGTAITPQAVWSDDPAIDILRVAAEPQVAWLLMGSHRAVFGNDFSGGVVREILEKARTLPLHVGVVIRGGEQMIERVAAVIDMSPHGRAALDLAVNVAQRRKCNLHAVLVPGRANAGEAELVEMLRTAGRRLGSRIHSDVLAHPSAAQLVRQVPRGLIVVGASLAEKLGVTAEGFADVPRWVVVVQSSDIADNAQAVAPERQRIA